jgi:hypothetical protein
MKNLRLMAFVLAAAVLLFSELLASGQDAAKVGGNVPYHSGNLLQNPNAQSPFNPAWTQSQGNWSIQTGSVNGLNSPDGTPWFLETGPILISCSTCFLTRTVSLVQTVDISAYKNLIHAYNTYFEYGGDAFGRGITSGNGISSAGLQASYTLEFFDSSGAQLGMDTSGPLLDLNFSCSFASGFKKNAGYRQTTTGIPDRTRSIRFTAKMLDRLSVCNTTFFSSGAFYNGFDNLWLDFIYLDGIKAQRGFTQGSAPGPAEKVKLTPRQSSNRKR